MRVTFLLFLCFIFITNTSGFADDKAKKQKQLTQLKSKIEKLRKTIEVKENSKSSYNRKLREIEKKIGKLSSKIRDSRQAIKIKKHSLNDLNKQKKDIQKDIANHNKQLSEQIHTAYTLGNQEQIKLLFSQKNAMNLQRNLTYYEYFSNYRLKQIDNSQKTIESLIQNEKKILAAKKDLENTLHSQQALKSSLNNDKTERKKIIINLQRELKKQGKHLTKLEDEAEDLKQLIGSLSQILIDSPEPRNIQKFSELKGKLSWPVKGNVKKLFGHIKPPSNLRWQGVVINSTRGNNVRAVSHGRVAFSDWLRGMGNLIIIDHGDGYLSLYGHNESLYKTTGDWVDAGDIIGSIGNSGGQSNDGVYFEIRRKGKPQNPSLWCNMKNWFTTI